MYPTLTDLIADFTGINVPLPIQTFGFFVAMAFLLSAYLWGLEIKRKEGEGLLLATSEKILKGARASKNELIINGITGAIVGYKLLYAFSNYAAFADNPQAMILSFKGSILGALLGAGLFAYLKYAEKEKEKLAQPVLTEIKTMPHEHVGSMIIIAAAGGLLGAKVFHNLENINDFISDPIGAIFSFSGLTWYGGLIVVAYLLWRYSKKHGFRYIHIMDASAPALMLGYAMGRVGCHVSGDGDWGIDNLSPKPQWMSSLPDWMWSYRYPNNVINEGVQIPGCAGNHCFMLENPVFPTPFYEVIMCSLLFLVLWGIRKRIQAPGVFFSIYLIFNGLERFIIEKIRINTLYDIFGGITQAEIISTFMVLAGVYGIYYFRKENLKVVA